MFKKLKIKLINGNLTQYRIFNFPLFEIERSSINKFKIHFCIFKNKKPDKNKPLFYLKFNRSAWTNCHCLQQWIYIINEMKGDFYIICDNKRAEAFLLERVCFFNNNIKIIGSIKNKLLKNLAKITCDKYWKNAFYAHLTPFVHAKENKIENFWNIDADDSTMFEIPSKIANCLSQVAQYADLNNINCFSYDVLQSLYKGKHWCFGVTYTTNNTLVYKVLKNFKNNEWQKLYIKITNKNNLNADWFFTYLKDNNILNIQSFMIKDLYYSHLGIGFDAFRIFFICKDNHIIYPLYKSYLPNDNMSSIPIENKTIVFDFNIEEKESKANLLLLFKEGSEGDYISHWAKAIY